MAILSSTQGSMPCPNPKCGCAPPLNFIAQTRVTLRNDEFTIPDIVETTVVYVCTKCGYVIPAR